jgi:hypothetical protein
VRATSDLFIEGGFAMSRPNNVSAVLALTACVAVGLATGLAGCGLAETGAAAAAGGASEAEAAKEGKKQMEKVKKDIEAAQKAEADARAAAEKASE